MTSAYPLQWPPGWPRTKRPESSAFATSFAKARDELLNELRLLGARNVVISANVPLRQDGLHYARFPEPADKGVAVYFVLDGNQRCIPCDQWNRTQDNIQAIRKTVEALRGLERWGAKEMVSAAFRGFQALPAPKQQETWWEVLQVSQAASEQEIREAFRKLARVAHPDAGGSQEEFIKLQKAYEEGLREARA